MERLVKNGDVILDGKQTKDEKVKVALKKLEEFENVLEDNEIPSISKLDGILKDFDKACEDVVELTMYLAMFHKFILVKGLKKDFDKFFHSTPKPTFKKADSKA